MFSDLDGFLLENSGREKLSKTRSKQVSNNTSNRKSSSKHESYETDINFLSVLLKQDEIKEENDQEDSQSWSELAAD